MNLTMDQVWTLLKYQFEIKNPVDGVAMESNHDDVHYHLYEQLRVAILKCTIMLFKYI